MLLARRKKDNCYTCPALAILPQPAERDGKKCRFSIPHSPGLELGEDAASSGLQEKQREVILGDASGLSWR